MSPKCRIALIVLTLAITLSGIVLFITAPYIFVAFLIPWTNIVPSSLTYSIWQNSMVPPSMSFYVYDLRNVKEVVQYGAKPFVVQRGPYTYRELRPKLNVTFNCNRTVTYNQPKTFVYLNESGDDDDVPITTLNMPILVLARLFAHLPEWSAFLADGVLEVLDGGSLFINRRATEAIWGWQDPMLHFVVERVEKWFHVKLNGVDLVGFYISHNATSEGIWNVWDGSSDYRRTNTIYAWKGATSVDFWSTPYANMLNGTDGLSYWPNLQQTDTLYLFHFDLCRSTRFEFDQVTLSKGIRLFRFVMPDNMVADSQSYPDNSGFCPPGAPCLKAGVWNVSRCKDGLPIVLSLPHFFLADPTYQDAVEGLSPSRSLHGSFLELEPLSGFTLIGHVRAQINVELNSIPGLPDTMKIESMLYPAIWIDHAGEMDDGAAAYTANMVYVPQIVLTIVVPTLLFAVGLVLSLVLMYRAWRQLKEDKQNGDEDTAISTNSNNQADEERALLVNSQAHYQSHSSQSHPAEV